MEEPQTPATDLTGRVRALIERMGPGEVLHLGERPVARYFYARVIPGTASNKCKYLESVTPNFEAAQQIQTMIENMVTAGELIETGGRWNWTKRLTPY